jgi:hypothetical protein
MLALEIDVPGDGSRARRGRVTIILIRHFLLGNTPGGRN